MTTAWVSVLVRLTQAEVLSRRRYCRTHRRLHSTAPLPGAHRLAVATGLSGTVSVFAIIAIATC